MRPDEFDYHLPEELIALEPAAHRDASRLLHVPAADALGHFRFADLPTLLKRGDLLVVNDTKVFPAALTATRPARAVGGGGDVTVDINLLHPAVETDHHVVWRAFARPAKRLREGDLLHISDGFTGQIVARTAGAVDIRFEKSPAELLLALEAAGDMPLPPYIARKRAPDMRDRERYQTVYAAHTGSVAAPTAGLHFTPDLFDALAQSGVETAHVTLHVGAGTFLPVTAESLDDHKMHAEWGEVSKPVADQINAAKAAGRRIVSVGTTSTRLLETAATGTGQIAPFRGETDIFITPGFDFKIVDALITNFHLPKSTLLMLISAFCGVQTVRDAYAAAVQERYRFYSYGDACLLERA